MHINDNTKPKTAWKTIICLDIPWLALKVWPVFGARGEIKHTSLTSPPPCFLATSWKPSRSFIKVSEPQKMHSEPQEMDSQHQVFTKKLKFDTKKGVFQHHISCSGHRLVDAQKTARPTLAPGLHQSYTNTPPEHQKLAKRFKPARGLAIYYRYNQDIWIVSKLHVYSRHTHVILDGILKVYEMVNYSCMK